MSHREPPLGCGGIILLVILLSMFVGCNVVMDKKCRDAGGVWLSREFKCVAGKTIWP